MLPIISQQEEAKQEPTLPARAKQQKLALIAGQSDFLWVVVFFMHLMAHFPLLLTT
jgi:hypothetical protein